MSFRRAARETGTGFNIISENTWHYAKHWKKLEEMGEKDFFGTKGSLLVPPKQWQRQKPNSARAVMTGLNINMSDEDTERIINSVRSGAETALR